MYHGFFVVELLSFLVDVLNVLLEFHLFLPALESIREKEFAIESSNLFAVLEELGVSLF